MKTRTLLCIATIIIGLTATAQENFDIYTYTKQKLDINVASSELKWSGEYAFYFGGHHGTIDFKNGYFIKADDVIIGGEFIIDMTSIKCDDIENGEANESLVNHLKDPDFFDVKNHKEAKLKITKIQYHNPTEMKVYADLTIKGITLPVDFQAEVNFEKKQMKTRFKIDRMRWGVNYNSALRDGALSDGIGFEVTLNLK